MGLGLGPDGHDGMDICIPHKMHVHVHAELHTHLIRWRSDGVSKYPLVVT